MSTLLDTHAWVWWVTEDRRLSRRARARIAAGLGARDLWISLISVWGVAKKVEKKQLVLDRPLDEWIEDAVTRPGLGVRELTRPILVQSCELPQPFHGDAADQMLVATARHHGATLLTRDQRILQYAHVQAVW